MSTTDFSSILALVRQAAAAAKSDGSLVASKRENDAEDEPAPKRVVAEQSIAEKFSSITGQALPESVLNSRAINFIIPSSQVGRIIGKGGETIHRLIEQAACHIQVTPDNGLQDRSITLTGTPEKLEAAKHLICKTLEDFNFMIPHPTTVWEEGSRGVAEVLISVGARTLLDDLRAEVEGIERDNHVTIAINPKANKPFRNNTVAVWITGAKDDVQRGLSQFKIFLARRDTTPVVTESSSAYGETMKTITIKVPKNVVGLVIGKGGETIKKIAGESGAKVQFDQSDVGEELRVCTIQGNQRQAEQAESQVRQILNESAQRTAGGPFVPSGQQLVRVSVPADKCGLVIGRGGEVIKSINSQSGARVDYDKTSQDNQIERIFNIIGTPQQIAVAQSMINEKVMPRAGGNFAPSSFNFGGGGSSAYDQFAAYSQQQYLAQQGMSTQTQATSQDEEQRKQWELYFQQMQAYQAYMAAQGAQTSESTTAPPGDEN